MTLPYQKYLDNEIKKYFNKLDITEFTSKRHLYYAIAIKYKTSYKYVEYVLKNEKFNYAVPDNFIYYKKINPFVSKFIRRHREGAVKKILNKIYLDKATVKIIAKKLGEKI